MKTIALSFAFLIAFSTVQFVQAGGGGGELVTLPIVDEDTEIVGIGPDGKPVQVPPKKPKSGKDPRPDWWKAGWQFAKDFARVFYGTGGSGR